MYKGAGTEFQKFSKLVRKDMVRICDPDLSRDEKRKMLVNPKVRGGIFSLLLSTVLPLLVSAYLK